MSVLAGFMVPHPPMIVPAVGRGSENQVLETIRAYERAAAEIAALCPDTLIITSPHSVMYADYFHISPGSEAKGSFRQFRAPEVKFAERYDTGLVDRICALAQAETLPAGTLGERDPALDHGTMVPLWFIRRQYAGGKLVRIGLSGLPLTEHYRLGRLIARAVEELGRRAVLIASGDLSHKLQSYGPYGFAEEGPEYDRRIMDVCGRAAFGELFEFDESFCEKAAECGHRSFVILAGAFDGLRVRAAALSHQDRTGVGYGICTFYPGGPDPERQFLKSYQEKTERECRERAEKSDAYVRLARAAVEAWVLRRERLPLPEGLPAEMLTRRAGAFVSLHEHGRLRGCIGTILPVTGSVAEEIVRNAVSAAIAASASAEALDSARSLNWRTRFRIDSQNSIVGSIDALFNVDIVCSPVGSLTIDLQKNRQSRRSARAYWRNNLFAAANGRRVRRRPRRRSSAPTSG